jgi:hypothetical protein
MAHTDVRAIATCRTGLKRVQATCCDVCERARNSERDCKTMCFETASFPTQHPFARRCACVTMLEASLKPAGAPRRQPIDDVAELVATGPFMNLKQLSAAFEAGQLVALGA